jgi:predicted enzyme related to lactoylglutathione lyase
MTDTVRGRFMWHELMSKDPKAAAAFYKDVVGWTSQPWDKDPSYTMLTAGGRPMAGTFAPPDADAPKNWLSYIGTPRLDVTARQVIELGGKVLKPAADIPDIGRFAILQDPQGAVFIAFTPKQAPADSLKPGLGDFSWHELVTTNWQAAFDFYQKLFGWEKTESVEMGPGNTYQMFGWKGYTLGAMFNKPAGPPIWLPYVLVPDAKKVVDTVKRLRGSVTNGPMEVPGGDWITQGIDPQGVMFAVHSKKPAAARPAPKAKPATEPDKQASKPAARPKPKKTSKPAARKPKPAARKPKPAPRTSKRAKKGGKRR